MIAQSQSGTGKTAAFALAVLSRINMNNKFPQVLSCIKVVSLGFSVSNSE